MIEEQQDRKIVNQFVVFPCNYSVELIEEEDKEGQDSRRME